MRPDMHKVIVERERLGTRDPSRPPPWEKNADLDDLPTKEGMRKRHLAAGSTRQLNENLAPLKRYLRQQVGRPWDVVYGEISRSLRPTSAVKQHVRDHLWDFVQRHASIGPNGEVYGPPPLGQVEAHPLTRRALHPPADRTPGDGQASAEEEAIPAVSAERGSWVQSRSARCFRRWRRCAAAAFSLRATLGLTW